MRVPRKVIIKHLLLSIQRNFGIDEDRLDLVGRGEHGDVARVVVVVVAAVDVVVGFVEHARKIV